MVARNSCASEGVTREQAEASSGMREGARELAFITGEPEGRRRWHAYRGRLLTLAHTCCYPILSIHGGWPIRDYQQRFARTSGTSPERYAPYLSLLQTRAHLPSTVAPGRLGLLGRDEIG